MKRLNRIMFFVLILATVTISSPSAALLNQVPLIDQSPEASDFCSSASSFASMAENFHLATEGDVDRVILWGIWNSGPPAGDDFTITFRYDAAGGTGGPTVPGDLFGVENPSCTYIDTGIDILGGPYEVDDLYQVVLELDTPMYVSTYGPRWLEIESGDDFRFLCGDTDPQATLSGHVVEDPWVGGWIAEEGNIAIMLIDQDEIMGDGFETGIAEFGWSARSPALQPGDEWYMARTSTLLGGGDPELGTLADNSGGADDSDCALGDTIDEWWRIRECPQGDRVVTTCSSSTTFDTVITAFDQTRETQYCNDDDGVCQFGTHMSTVTLPAGSGYHYIRVSAFNNYVGTGDYYLWLGYCSSK